MEVQNIAATAKRKAALERFLQKFDEAIRELPPMGQNPRQQGLEMALQINISNAMGNVVMMRSQLG